jgi:hypothetical protein
VDVHVYFYETTCSFLSNEYGISIFLIFVDVDFDMSYIKIS